MRRSRSATHGSVPMPGRLRGSGCACGMRGRRFRRARARGRAVGDPADPSVELPDGPDAPRSVVVLLDRVVRAVDAPLDGDDPARLSRDLGSRSVRCRSRRNVDWWSAEWANRAFLEPFIDPATPIGPHARTLIGIALGAREAGERGLATDVVRLALADGRLTASALAEGLMAAAAAACDRPNRWAVSLADVATGSTGHATAVADAIGPSLPALADRPPAKLVPLLRLLDELLAGSGTPPWPTVARHSNASPAGGGQAGRLARSILSRGWDP